MKKKYNQKTNALTHKITLISVLVAIGVIISIVDKMVSSVAFPFLPMAKIGLANVVILFGVYRFSIVDSLVMTILKSVLVGLIFGSIMSFAIGFTGSLLSFIAMTVVHRLAKDKVSIIGVSVVGGLFHITGQCLAILLIYQLGDELMLYGALLILFSLVTSILVGFVSKKTIKYLDMYLK